MIFPCHFQFPYSKIWFMTAKQIYVRLQIPFFSPVELNHSRNKTKKGGWDEGLTSFLVSEKAKRVDVRTGKRVRFLAEEASFRNLLHSQDWQACLGAFQNVCHVIRGMVECDFMGRCHMQAPPSSLCLSGFTVFQADNPWPALRRSACTTAGRSSYGVGHAICYWWLGTSRAATGWMLKVACYKVRRGECHGNMS